MSMLINDGTNSNTHLSKILGSILFPSPCLNPSLQPAEAALQRCLRKRCSENMQLIYTRTPVKITRRHGCSPVNLLDIFKTPFYKNAYGGLLLTLISHIFLVLFSHFKAISREIRRLREAYKITTITNDVVHQSISIKCTD